MPGEPRRQRLGRLGPVDTRDDDEGDADDDRGRDEKPPVHAGEYTGPRQRRFGMSSSVSTGTAEDCAGEAGTASPRLRKRSRRRRSAGNLRVLTAAPRAFLLCQEGWWRWVRLDDLRLFDLFQRPEDGASEVALAAARLTFALAEAAARDLTTCPDRALVTQLACRRANGDGGMALVVRIDPDYDHFRSPFPEGGHYRRSTSGQASLGAPGHAPIRSRWRSLERRRATKRSLVRPDGRQAPYESARRRPEPHHPPCHPHRPRQQRDTERP